MNADRIPAILAGALYFLGLVAGVFSVVPVIDLPDYLTQISANIGQVTSGAFFQFLMMAAYVGMAITLYPILKKHNESLALGYVGSRLVAAAFNVIGVIILLLLSKHPPRWGDMPENTSHPTAGLVFTRFTASRHALAATSSRLDSVNTTRASRLTGAQ